MAAPPPAKYDDETTYYGEIFSSEDSSFTMTYISCGMWAVICVVFILWYCARRRAKRQRVGPTPSAQPSRKDLEGGYGSSDVSNRFTCGNTYNSSGTANSLRRPQSKYSLHVTGGVGGEEEEDSSEEETIIASQELRLQRKTTVDLKRNRQRRRERRGVEEVRVFVSSTFVDFFEEREHLVKEVFPVLRRKCEGTGVPFVEIDLRTGVTAEQGEAGETINICLAEIGRCRPYFIGLLGERYGWSRRDECIEPWEGNNEAIMRSFDLAIQRNPSVSWINEYRSRSVTELEVRHAVLNDPSNATGAFFYIRNPNYVNEVAPAQRQGFSAEDRECAEKLARLKDDVRKCGRPVTDYDRPGDLATFVLKDLMERIEGDLPLASDMSPLDRQSFAHEAFMQNRCRLHIGHEEELAVLNKHLKASGKNGPLAVLGDSGSGKTSLLAVFAKEAMDRSDVDFTFYHSIGCTEQSTDSLQLIRRLMGELKREFDIEMAVPTDGKELMTEFEAWIKLASTKGNILIVLDALNQLESNTQNHTLQWLPSSWPHSIHVILSTIHNTPSHRTIMAKRWKELVVKPLQKEQRAEIVRSYLRNYNKSLTTEQLEIVASSPRTASPLFLLATLNEIRMYGTYENFTSVIREYASAEDIGALYEMILTRVEKDFDVDCGCKVDADLSIEATPKLVPTLLCLVYFSHQGMTESVLYDVTKVATQQSFSGALLGMDGILLNKSGQFGFFHDQARIAVRKKYLQSQHMQTYFRRVLRDYWKSSDDLHNKTTELPIQLIALKELSELRAFITNISVFMALFTEGGKMSLFKFWREAGGYEQATGLYSAELDRIDPNLNRVDRIKYRRKIAEFLIEIGLGENNVAWKMLKTASEDARELVNEIEVGGDRESQLRHSVNDAKLDLSTILMDMAQLELWPSNVVTTNEAIAIREDILGPMDTLVADGWYQLGTIYEANKNFFKVKPCYQKALCIYESFDPSSVQVARCEIGISDIYSRRLKHSKAARKIGKALKIMQARVGSSHPLLAHTYRKIALLNHNLANQNFRRKPLLTVSCSFFNKALKILAKTVGPSHPSYTRVQIEMASVLDDLGEQKESVALYVDAIRTLSTTGTWRRKLKAVTTSFRLVYSTIGSRSLGWAIASVIAMVAIGITIWASSQGKITSSVLYNTGGWGSLVGLWSGSAWGARLRYIVGSTMIWASIFIFSYLIAIELNGNLIPSIILVGSLAILTFVSGVVRVWQEAYIVGFAFLLSTLAAIVGGGMLALESLWFSQACGQVNEQELTCSGEAIDTSVEFTTDCWFDNSSFPDIYCGLKLDSLGTLMVNSLVTMVGIMVIFGWARSERRKLKMATDHLGKLQRADEDMQDSEKAMTLSFIQK